MSDGAIQWERSADGITVSLSGRPGSMQVAEVWAPLIKALESGSPVTVRAGTLESADGSVLALLQRICTGGTVHFDGLPDEVGRLLEPFEGVKLESPPPPRPPGSMESVGRLTADFLRDLQETVTFLGRTVATFGLCFTHPRLIRWKDLWLTCERAGINALLIVGMISLLTGMILAFQAAAALRQFGVEIFVVNLVSLAMLREMGVIMTAVVLAGRSGSAFAAEIGTMKVNEEIDALSVMGLDPVRFLVIPRVMAGVLIMPVLTLYADVLGVAGGFLVMRMEGFAFPALWAQMLGAVTLPDLLTGFIKSFFFGFLVAGIGCFRGLQTRSGASAVGVSTTRAVVSGIFLIVVADAIFSGLFYVIGF